MSVPLIREGDAYALIAIHGAAVAAAMPDAIQLDDGLWASRECPVDLPKHWQEWLGSIASRDIRESSLFVFATSGAQARGIPSALEEACYEEARHLLWGLYLSDRFSTGGPPHRVSGTAGDEGVRVQTHQMLEAMVETPGIETDWVAVERLSRSLSLGRTIRRFSLEAEPKRFHRLRRILYAFTSAAASANAADRIHEFVRVIEGFIRPDPGKTSKQFKNRTELFVGAGKHELMGELFDIRSSVEHLHGAFAAVVGDSDRDRALVVIQRALEAESVARYCIIRFLERSELWPHFANDDALDAFWKMPAAERQKLWGSPFDVTRIALEFDASFVPDYALP